MDPFSWHRVGIQRPGDRVEAVVRGRHGSLYVLTREVAGRLMLGRITDQNRNVWEVPVTIGASEHLRLAVDARNNVVVAGRGGGGAEVVFVAQWGEVLWNQAYSGAGAGTVTDIAVAAADQVYVSLVTTGALEVSGTTFHDNSVLAAYAIDGDVLWTRKVLGKIGGLAMTPTGLVLAGVAEGALFVRTLSYEGAGRQTFPVSDVPVATVTDVISRSDAAFDVSGATVIDGKHHIFHGVLEVEAGGASFRQCSLVPVSSEIHISHLVFACDAVLLFLNILDQGCWLVRAGQAVHHLSAQYGTGAPQVVSSVGVGVYSHLFLGGMFAGTLTFDKEEVEVGRTDYVPFTMQFLP
jgi:hypothetical protein